MKFINEIKFNEVLENRTSTLRKKLFNIGLWIGELEFLGSYVNSINLDIINTEKYYDRFMKEYDYLDFSDIRNHDDYKNYDYDDKTFIMEEMETSFNDPYNNMIRDKDINTLNNDLINKIIIKCVNYLNKDFNNDDPNPIKIVFKA
jgi:hypothetical protein